MLLLLVVELCVAFIAREIEMCWITEYNFCAFIIAYSSLFIQEISHFYLPVYSGFRFFLFVYSFFSSDTFASWFVLYYLLCERNFRAICSLCYRIEASFASIYTPRRNIKRASGWPSVCMHCILCSHIPIRNEWIAWIQWFVNAVTELSAQNKAPIVSESRME